MTADDCRWPKDQDHLHFWYRLQQSESLKSGWHHLRLQSVQYKIPSLQRMQLSEHDIPYCTQWIYWKETNHFAFIINVNPHLWSTDKLPALNAKGIFIDLSLFMDTQLGTGEAFLFNFSLKETQEIIYTAYGRCWDWSSHSRSDKNPNRADRSV